MRRQGPAPGKIPGGPFKLAGSRAVCARRRSPPTVPTGAGGSGGLRPCPASPDSSVQARKASRPLPGPQSRGVLLLWIRQELKVLLAIDTLATACAAVLRSPQVIALLARAFPWYASPRTITVWGSIVRPLW
jgi:hypothetical protein